MLKDQIGDQLAKNASSFLGESQDNVGSALDGIFPSLLGKVADMAQDKAGAESIFDMVNKTDDSILENIGGLFGGGPDAVNKVLGSGSGIVNSVFGGGLGSVIEKIAGISGLKKSSSSSLVKMAAPFLFGIVKRAVMKKGLNAVGLGSLLGEQTSFIQKALPAGLGSVLGLGKNLLSGAANTGKAAVSGAMDTGKNIVGGAGDLAGKAVGGAGKVVGGAANVAGNVGNAAVKTGGGLMKWLIPALLALLALGFFGFKTGCGAVDNMADKTADMTKGAVAKTGELAGDAVKGAGDVVKGAGEMAGDAVKGAGGMLAGAFGKVNEAAKAALDKVEFAAGSAGDQMVKFIDGGFKGNGTFQIKNGNFASGSDKLTAETKKELDNLTAVLNAYPGVKLSVDGYTDNTGNAAKNKTLSEMRAKSVKGYLIQKGIKGNRIMAKGYGDANPIASNDTKEGQAKNRRIELKVIK